VAVFDLRHAMVICARGPGVWPRKVRAKHPPPPPPSSLPPPSVNYGGWEIHLLRLLAETTGVNLHVQWDEPWNTQWIGPVFYEVWVQEIARAFKTEGPHTNQDESSR